MRAVAGTELLPHQADRGGVVDIAGHGNDRVGRSVRRAPEVADRLVGECADPCLLAADLATQWSIAEHRGLEQDLGVLGRVVLIATDLFDDDAPLALDLIGAQCRADDSNSL